MIQLSFGSWAFAAGPYADAPIPLDRVCARLAEAEYDGIELSGLSPHAPLDRYSTSKSQRRLARMLADHRLGVSGYSPDFSAVNPLVEGNKLSYVDVFNRAVDFCVEVGCPSIRVDSVAAPGSVSQREYQAACDRLADVWTDAAEVAEGGKVRMVWEFEPGCIFNKPSEILALHNRVGHPNFGILFDTAHAYMCSIVGARQQGVKQTLPGGPPEFLKKLEGRVGAIHLMDSDGTLHHKESSTHRPFGEGFIDFHILAPQLLDVTNVEWWCIDLSFCPGAWDLIEPSRDFVLELLDTKVAA
jgi:sugar phosphate isomerase/epimerase